MREQPQLNDLVGKQVTKINERNPANIKSIEFDDGSTLVLQAAVHYWNCTEKFKGVYWDIVKSKE